MVCVPSINGPGNAGIYACMHVMTRVCAHPPKVSGSFRQSLCWMRRCMNCVYMWVYVWGMSPDRERGGQGTTCGAMVCTH